MPFAGLPEGAEIVEYAGLPDGAEIVADGMEMQPSHEVGVAPTVKPDISLADMATQAVQNAPSSAANLVGNIAQAVTHPIDTATGLYRLAGSAADLLIPGEWGNEHIAREVGKFYADRYGGKNNIMQTIAQDPVGVLADASTLVTGAGGVVKGAGTLAKAPTVANAGSKMLAAGRAAEPVGLAARGVKVGAAKLVPDFVKESLSPEGLYASAMKFSNDPSVLSTVDRRRAIDAGLKGGYTPSNKSYDRLWETVTGNKAKVNNIVEQGAQAGDTVATSEVLRFLKPIKDRTAIIAKSHPEFAQAIADVEASMLNYGDNIPVKNAQILKETIQDLSKYGTEDRSRFVYAANKAIARGLRVQLEQAYPELVNLNRKSSSLLALERQLGKATGRIQNRDVVGLGLKVGMGGVSGPMTATQKTGLLSSIFDNPSLKARLAIALYEARTGKRLPSSQWKKAADAVFGADTRNVANQSGRMQTEGNQPLAEGGNNGR